MFAPTASPVVHPQSTWHIGPTTCVVASRSFAWRDTNGSVACVSQPRIASSSPSIQRASAIASAADAQTKQLARVIRSWRTCVVIAPAARAPRVIDAVSPPSVCARGTCTLSVSRPVSCSVPSPPSSYSPRSISIGTTETGTRATPVTVSAARANGSRSIDVTRPSRLSASWRALIEAGSFFRGQRIRRSLEAGTGRIRRLDLPVLASELRVDDGVGAAAGLEIPRAVDALARVAAALRHDLGRRVLRVDQQLDPLERELGEGPVRQQEQRAGRNAAGARARGHDVPGLRLLRLEIEAHESHQAEEVAALDIDDREARVRPVLAPLRVTLDPALAEVVGHGIGHAREARDAVVARKLVHRRRVRGGQRLESDVAVAGRRHENDGSSRSETSIPSDPASRTPCSRSSCSIRMSRSRMRPAMDARAFGRHRECCTKTGSIRFAIFTSWPRFAFDAPSSSTRSYATPERWWMPSSTISRLQRSSRTVPGDAAAIIRKRGMIIRSKNTCIRKTFSSSVSSARNIDASWSRYGSRSAAPPASSASLSHASV